MTVTFAMHHMWIPWKLGYKDCNKNPTYSYIALKTTLLTAWVGRWKDFNVLTSNNDL